MTQTLQKIDEYGRAILTEQGLLEAFYRGNDMEVLYADQTPDITRYNEVCRDFDSREKEVFYPQTIEETPEEFHAKRQSEWLIPRSFQDIDIRAYLLERCSTTVERDRVLDELSLYESRDILPLLNVMIYIVDILTKGNVIWGVGRGSSVASYCLYLIGIHRIDSIKYDLDVREFIR